MYQTCAKEIPNQHKLKKQSLYTNGKLLITGEYLVLQGALALAVPTVMGQQLDVSMRREGDGKTGSLLSWKSYYEDDCWFEVEFSLPDLEVKATTDEKKALFLQQLLSEANRLNADIFRKGHSFTLETKLDFHPGWGLGSSSSLISMLAEWFRIDSYELFRKTQKGSGYDIACATSDSPLWYRLVLGSPIRQRVSFDPPFKENIAFVYSGKKQDSAAAVNHYLTQKNVADVDKARISQIGRDITTVNKLAEFNALLDEHEEIMSGILDIPKIKDLHFSDFPGSIKSLGAWGGDFLLASSEIGFNQIKPYFSKKGLDIVFSFDHLVLGAKS